MLVTSLVTLGETGGPVGVGVSACGMFAGIQNTRQINISRSTSAMTSLNRSYPGAHADVSMLTVKPFLAYVERIPWLA